MEIRAAGPGADATAVAVTMRTPGHDFELAAGFLFTEGLVAADVVALVRYCELPDGQPPGDNICRVHTGRPFHPGRARPFLPTASCGICGPASIHQVEVSCPTVV